MLSCCCLNSTSLLGGESGGLDGLEVLPDQVTGSGKILELLDTNRRIRRNHFSVCERS